MRTTIRLTAASVALALVVCACGGSGGTSDGSASPSVPHASMSITAGPRPSTDATLSIVSPKNGETIQGTDVTLKLKLEGGTISDSASAELVPDQGHLHVVLDDQLISMTSDLESVLPDLAPGMHLLKIEFVANDHAPFDPRVIAAVSFEVPE